jgi:hypothetical protein
MGSWLRDTPREVLLRMLTTGRYLRQTICARKAEKVSKRVTLRQRKMGSGARARSSGMKCTQEAMNP